MKFCPHCQAPGKVLETRYSPKEGCKRRRIGCTSCGFRWSTWGDVDPTEIDQKLDADGLPTYTEALQVLEALVRSAGGCATIDRIAVTKAWKLIDRYKVAMEVAGKK